MLTDQQTATIEHRVGRIHARHIADLHAISNAALAKLRPDNKASYGGIFNGLVEDTMAAIRKLEAELSKDIPALARTLKPNLDESDRDQILRVSQRALSAELYEKRLASFKESYSRRMAGYGVVSSLSDHRFDLIEARYTAGTQNAVRRAVAELKNALDSHVYADRSSTPSQPSSEESSLLREANEVVDLKPNFLGIGININRLIDLCLRRRGRT